MHNLGMCLLEIGEYDRALIPLEYALQINLRFLKDDDFAVIESRTAMLTASERVGDHKRALDMTNDLLNSVNTTNHQQSLKRAVALHNLANVALRNRNLNTAAEFYDEAVKIIETCRWQGHPDTYPSVIGLARTSVLAGHHRAGFRYYRAAHEVATLYFGEGAQQIATVLHEIASLLYANGRPRYAWRCFQRALSFATDNVGERSQQAKLVRVDFSQFLFAHRQWEAAYSMAWEAVTKSEPFSDGSRRLDKLAYTIMYWALVGEGRSTEAREFRNSYRDIDDSLLWPNNGNRLWFQLKSKAPPLFRRCLEYIEQGYARWR
jgi:tetratricopeptide (TPR) repeat protein